jgi:hypothetical protein
VRETVRKSLQEIKQYWQERGIWYDTEPIELYGETVEKPDEFVFRLWIFRAKFFKI